MGAQPPFDPTHLRDLPQAMGRWELGVRPAPSEMRLVEPGHVLSVLDPRSGLARASGVVPEPTLDALLSVLNDAMTQSASGQAACRPRQLAVETAGLQRSLQVDLDPCGIPVVLVPMLPLVDDFMESMREHLSDRPPRSPIGALVMERPLAEAAARIAALEPWRYLPGELPLLVADEGSDDPPKVLVVMGLGRSVEGVAAYQDEAQLEKAIEAGQPMGAWCLLFHRAFEVPRQVRDEFIQLGLPVAHGLYPHVALLKRAGVPDVVEQEEDAKRIIAELEALEHYIRDCSQALADGKDPKRSGLELSNGCRVSVTPRRDLMPDDLDGGDEDLELAHRDLTGGEESALLDDDLDVDIPEELSRRLSGELESVRGAGVADVVASLSDDAVSAPPSTDERGRKRLAGSDESATEAIATALGIELGLGEVPYRITLSTLPTASAKGARGARVALWQVEQRHGKLPGHMPAIILKMARQAAEDAARALHDMSRASFQRVKLDATEYEALLVCRDDGEETLLASWPLTDGAQPPSAWCRNADVADEALLLFVSGGAARTLRTLAPNAIIGGHVVDVERDPPDPSPQTAPAATSNPKPPRSKAKSKGNGRGDRTDPGQPSAKGAAKKRKPAGARRSKR